MAFNEETLIAQCTFCAKSKDECELIEMSTNSIILDEEVLEFCDLIRGLFDAKVC